MMRSAYLSALLGATCWSTTTLAAINEDQVEFPFALRFSIFFVPDAFQITLRQEAANCPKAQSETKDLLEKQASGELKSSVYTVQYCGGSIVSFGGSGPISNFTSRVEKGLVFDPRSRRPIANILVRFTAAAGRLGPEQLQPNIAYLAGVAEKNRLKMVMSTARSVPGAPNAQEIAATMAAASAEYSGGVITDNPGELAIPSVWGGVQQYTRQIVDTVNCQRLSAAKFKCSYYMTWRVVGASDSVLGQLAQAFSTVQRSRWSATFQKTAQGWSSPEVIESNRQAAERMASRNTSSASSNSYSSGEDYAARMQKTLDDINYINDVLTYRPYSNGQ